MYAYWNIDDMCGHKIIDEEHAEIVKMTDRFYDAYKSGKSDAEEILTMIEEFMASLKDHIEHEEDMMSTYSYPKKEEHIRAHRDIMDKLERIVGQIKSDGLIMEVCDSLYVFVVNWYNKHTKIYDKVFAEFLTDIQKRKSSRVGLRSYIGGRTQLVAAHAL